MYNNVSAAIQRASHNVQKVCVASKTHGSETRILMFQTIPMAEIVFLVRFRITFGSLELNLTNLKKEKTQLRQPLYYIRNQNQTASPANEIG